MKFNYRDASRARAMRRRGVTEETVLSYFNNKYAPRDIDELIVGLRSRNKKYRQENFSKPISSSNVEAENRPSIPPEVIEVRDERVMLQPLTITAFLMGDPLPGESALDRRQLT